MVVWHSRSTLVQSTKLEDVGPS